MKIGVFDSGFGGLAVFRTIKDQLPDFDYVYLADTARAPYGNHSHDIIFQYVVEAVDYLFRQDCQLVILACNTASAQALRQLQQEWLPKQYPDRRVLGVIRPIAEAVAKVGAGKKIGVIGTRATVQSGAYTREIRQQLDEKAVVIETACPLLVPMIEEGFSQRPEFKRMLRYYLRPLKAKGVRVLVNGCTHYELVRKDIELVMGKQVEVLDSPAIVAQSLADYLHRHPELAGKLSRDATIQFMTTDKHERFDMLAAKFWGKPVKAEIVRLGS